MSTCSSCGYSNVSGSIFCEECGNTLDANLVASTQKVAAATVTKTPATQDIRLRAKQTDPTLHESKVEANGATEPSAPPTTALAYLITESGRRIDVPAQDVVIVGREDMRSGTRPDVDLTLDGASAAGVSRRHCRLLRQESGWQVEDLMSTNHTLVNGHVLAAHTPTAINDNDELRLGKLRLQFHNA